MNIYLPNLLKIIGVMGILCVSVPSGAQHSHTLAQAKWVGHATVAKQPNQKTLRQVLMSLESEYKVLLSFNDEHVEDKYVDTDQFQGATLESILSAILPPLKLQYTKLDADHYVIESLKEKKEVNKIKKKRPEDSGTLEPGNRKVMLAVNIRSVPIKVEIAVAGNVTDASDGSALPGVNILVKGTTIGTVTDIEGNYRISVPDEADILVFSSVGYETKEEFIAGRTIINVAMSQDIQALSEVVVVGYGTQRKRDLTGSVASISSEKIMQVPVTDLNRALQGNAPGVRVNQTSGSPGSSAIVRIRGANTLTAANEPLYVVDGVLINGSIGPELSINDIKSVEVLKDASATAIYGSRGANGVIVITTKRGAEGTTTFSYDSYVSIQSLIKNIGLLNAADFKTLHTEAFAANGLSPDQAVVNSSADIDWQDELYQNAMQTSHQLSVSGGNEKSQYYLSGNYLLQEGLIEGTELERIAFRLNGDHKIGESIEVRNNLMLSRATNNFINNDQLANAVLWAPPTLPVRDNNGNYTVVAQPFARTNPIGLRELQDFSNTTLKIIGNLGAVWEIGGGFSADVNLGIDQGITEGRQFSPSAILGSNGDASRSNTNNFTWLTDYLLRYEKQFGEHAIKAVAGVTLQKFSYDFTNSSNSLFPDESLNYNALQDGANPRVSANLVESSLISYLGRVNYIYKDKYLLTLSGRYDGSSRLGEGNRFQFFPSTALAWRLSNEPFIADLGIFNDLKVRASYGLTGNQSVDPNSTFTLLRSVSYSPEELAGFVPNRLGNPALEWEKTTQFDIGLDFSLFNGRLQFTADYYHKKTEDLLLNIQLPASSGFITAFGDVATDNVGELENKGFEFEVTTSYITGPLVWTSSYNMFLNRAEVLDLGILPNGASREFIFTDQSFGSGLIVQVGEAPYQPFGQVTTGIGDNGEFALQDNDGDGAITDLDRVIIGNLEPDFTFGLTNNINYQNFNLSFQFVGSIGQDILAQAVGASYALNGQFNILQSVFEERGVTAPTPRSDRPGSQNTNTAFIFNGSYARFRDITLSYTLPEQVFEAFKLRLYVSGQNLISMVDDAYPLYDPEMSTSSTVFGVDRGGYPTAKSVTFGLNLNF